ncbi:MAG TPA: amino acid adenylation domain-containing protein [Steroidobacteraceae bacterium]
MPESNSAPANPSQLELERALLQFNNTAVEFPGNLMVHQIFEEQVEATPELTAVIHGEESVTYADLNSRANQLARHLFNIGIAPEQLVGIFLERSLHVPISLLATLKAGGAYLPLDPSYPPERLRHMLEEARPCVILTQRHLRERLPSSNAEIIDLDVALRELSTHVQENLPISDVGVSSDNLLYLIYTSGSTGKPKGTAMAHHAMVNLIHWHRSSLGPATRQNVLQFAALSFDVAFQEIFTTLCSGGTLVLLDEWVRRDARALMQLLKEQHIHRLFVPPMLLQAMAEYASSTGELPLGLRDVITAGEQLRISPEVFELFKQLNGQGKQKQGASERCLSAVRIRSLGRDSVCRLHNHYGPTETHVVTSLTLDTDPLQWPALPAIGRPIANARAYILDEQRRPLPVGATGELYIGGVPLARGYLRNPELTQQRFIPDPFSHLFSSLSPMGSATTRLYKTGDLARWRPDGTLEYLGRNDDQVKIRGFRVELGEIQSHLIRHPLVKDAVVVAKEDSSGDRRLVAYVVPNTSEAPGADGLSNRIETSNIARAPSVESLRNHLKVLLPEHMIPSAFVTLPELPLSPNGKLERRALPAPERSAYFNRQYEPPQGDLEQTLASIWQSVLRLERVGRHDNFFELGGHSLLIVTLQDRLRRLGFHTEAHCVYANPTISTLAQTLANAAATPYEIPANRIPAGCEAITPSMLPLIDLEPQHIAAIADTVPGGAANIQDIYPLAPLQEGVFFHHLLKGKGGDTYLLPILFAISSRDKVEQFIGALQRVIDRHDVLRTAVLWDQLPRPLQVVYRKAILPVEELTPFPSPGLLEQLQEWMRPDGQSIEVSRAPLMHLQIVEDPPHARWYALLRLHHLACDHESLEVLLTEVMTCMEGGVDRLPAAEPYRDHVAQSLYRADLSDAEAFFRRKLGDIDEPTAPFGVTDLHGDGSRIEEARQILEPHVCARLRDRARRMGVSAATVFHALWALVVARSCDRDEVVYATLLSGRLQSSAGAQRILGMFINTLPLRLSLGETTVAQLIEQTHRELMELLHHEQASLAVAQRCSAIKAPAPLFTTLLNYLHSTPLPQSLEPGTGNAVQLLSLKEWTNYPIVLTVDDKGEGFALTVQTDRRIDPKRILGYVDTTLKSLIESLEEAPQTPISMLTILPEEERRQLTRTFNATRRPYPEGELVHEMFQSQVWFSPDTPAVICGDQELSYAELNDRANLLARTLLATGVRPDDRIALYVGRSLDMIVGMLAVLKAGGAYVPLDPAYPAQRLAHMLRDSASKVLLTQGSLRGSAPETDIPVISIDAPHDELDWQSSADPDPVLLGLKPHHMAYVIYTSGSTGVPKGVVIAHRNLANLIHWHCEAFDLCRGSRGSSLAAVGFDAAAWEIWPLLSVGGTVVLAPPATTDNLDELLHWWSTQRLDISFLPTPVAELAFSRGIGNPHLRTLLIGGDRLRANPGPQSFRVVNNYGPTETTIVATSGSVHTDDQSLHIGRPIANTQIYILDSRRRPVPLGATGEIYIAGSGVARGYLNRPELTQERFVINPFGTGTQARMYRSGDLGRWRADGTIEFLGRLDHQIKLRGYRIELGEIESALAQCEQVRDAIVLAREDEEGERRLVAYITRADDEPGSQTIKAEDLRAQVSATLPEYMIPAAFVTIDSLPLTPNGKLDRNALPEPDPAANPSDRYTAPQGETEVLLANLWQDLLSTGPIGREANFFRIGGQSLLATRMMAKLRAALYLDIPMSLLFEFPTVRQLAAAIERLQQSMLLEKVEQAGAEIDELLASVASMSESRVQELMRKLQTEGRS